MNTARGATPDERPLVPYYTDSVACALCGGDGHTAENCFVRDVIDGYQHCEECLGVGSVLRVVGCASIAVACESCSERDRLLRLRLSAACH